MEAIMNLFTYNTTNSGTRDFIMDGGLETTLIYKHGYDLPEFAAFPLLDKEKGRNILRDYYLSYIHVARKNGYGFILEGPTYRASSSWGGKLGYDASALKRINTEAISFLTDFKTTFADEDLPMLQNISLSSNRNAKENYLKQRAKVIWFTL